MPRPLRFRAAIYRVGMNYCVDAPIEASRALEGGGERYVRVAGTADGHAFRSRLTRRRDGAYRLFLNGEVRSAAGVGPGDEVEIALTRDDEPREPVLPGDLRAALGGLEGGAERFAALGEAQRAGMVAYVERARTPATRARYVQRVVDEVRKRRRG